MRLRNYFIFLFILIITSGLYIIYSTVGFSFLYNRLFEIKFDEQDTRCDVGALREKLSEQIRLLKVQLHRARTLRVAPDRNMLNNIESIIWELDPTYSTLTPFKSPDVCAEVYSNNSIGYPLYDEGFFRPCGNVNLNDLLTVILFPVPVPYGNCSVYAKWVLTGLTQYYPSVRVVIVNRYDQCRIDASEFELYLAEIDFSASINDGEMLNTLIKDVKTPYVFIGRNNLDHLNQLARFERQVSVFAMDQRVKIVTGAARNLSGHWKVGCFQTEMKNYVLRYVEGYHSSKNECMFCDYVSGPFMARTDFLKEVSFDQNLPNRVVFDDFFMRVRNEGNFILNCPDVMYFSSQNRPNRRFDWLPLAFKWKLNYVILHKTKFQFSCRDIRISCDSFDKTTKNRLIPPCCIDQSVDAFKFIQNLAEKYKFRFELDTGSALGVVKMRGVLPWDVDEGISYLSSQWNSIVKLKDLFEQRNLTLEVVEDYGYIRLMSSNRSIGLWSKENLSGNLLPVEIRNLTTKAEMNGVWIYAPANPGLFVKNKYGVEYLHHWKLMEKLGNCQEMAYHACLERFYGDGNFQFFV